MPVDCIDSSDCPTGAQGTTVTNSWDIVSPLLNGGMPLVTVIKKNWPNLGSLFFTVEYETDGQMTYMKYKFKNGGKGMGTMGRNWTPVKTNDNCAIEWREEVICRPYTTVNGNQTADNTLTVTNINDLLGIGVGSRIHIVSRSTQTIIDADVASIAGNVITLANSQTVTVLDGDKVYRGSYTRDPSCTATISNRYTVRTKKKYESYFRKLNLTHYFESCDLSLDRYSASGADSTQEYLASIQQAGDAGFLLEFQDAVFFDRNLPEGNTVNENGGAETMGLLPAIQEAQTATGKKYIFDYSGCCDVDGETDCVGTSKMIGAWLENLLDVSSTGFYTDGVITVLANDKQLRAINLMAPDMNEYFGLQMMSTANIQDGVQIGAYLPKIQYGGKTIEFLYEESFDMMEWPFHVILPKDQMMLFQKQYAAVTLNDGGSDFKATAHINEQLNNGYPVMKFRDRTDFLTNGMDGCQTFVGEFTFAIAWAGMDKNAYQVGINFAPCNEVCDLCTDDTEVTFLVSLEDS